MTFQLQEYWAINHSQAKSRGQLRSDEITQIKEEKVLSAVRTCQNLHSSCSRMLRNAHTEACLFMRSNQSSLGLLMSPKFGWRQINVCWYQLGQEPGTDPAVVANEKTVWCVWRRGRRNHFQISQNHSQKSPSQQYRTETHRRCTYVQNACTKTDYIVCKCDIVQVSTNLTEIFFTVTVSAEGSIIRRGLLMTED